MALNPSIALSVRPVEIADPMANYAKLAAVQQAQNQNALAQYQLSAAQRSDALQEQRNALMSQAGGNPDKVANALLQAGDIKGYTDFSKARTESAKTNAEVIGAHMKLARDRLDQVQTPEDYLAWHNANHTDPVLNGYFASIGVNKSDSESNILQKLQQPGGFQSLLAQSAIGLEKLSKRTLTSQNLGDRTRILATPEYAMPGQTPASQVVQGSEGVLAMSPEAQAANAVARGNLALSQQRFAFEQANPGFDFRETENGLVAVNKRTGQSRPVTDASGQPLADSGRPLTETQGKAAGFGLRMESAEKAIAKATGSSSPDAWEKWLAGTAARGATSEQAQQVRQAQANWVRANLRLESGAVIGPDEMQEEINTYFPKFGDGPKVIEQKRQARLDAQAAVKTAASPAGMRAVRKTREALEAPQSSRPQPTAPSIDALLDKYR